MKFDTNSTFFQFYSTVILYVFVPFHQAHLLHDGHLFLCHTSVTTFCSLQDHIVTSHYKVNKLVTIHTTKPTHFYNLIKQYFQFS